MKLVRDGVPAVVAAKGETEPFRQVVDDAEHDALLNCKFDEELGEWREDHDPVELADLLAVVRDVAARQGTGWDELLEMEQAKRDRHGGYLGGVVWLGDQRRPYDADIGGSPAKCRWCDQSIAFLPAEQLPIDESAWAHVGPQPGTGRRNQIQCEPDMQSMTAEPALARAVDACCGSRMYWCPIAHQMECPTHGGSNVCCDRPERHTPLIQFEPQANALLNWWRENRQADVLIEMNISDDEEADRG